MRSNEVIILALFSVLFTASGAIVGLRPPEERDLFGVPGIDSDYQNDREIEILGIHTTEFWPGFLRNQSDFSDIFETTEIPQLLTTTEAKPEPTLLQTVGNNYTFLVVGLDIQDGRYMAQVRDGKIELDIIPGQGSEQEHENVSTTTSKYPPPQKILTETEEIIQKGREAINAYQLSTMQFRTQMNLNALHSLLPVFLTIENNMKLLLNSSIQDPETYSGKNGELEGDLIQAEAKLIGSRAVIQNISILPHSIHQQLLTAHGSLVNILNSQMEVLALPISRIRETNPGLGTSTSTTPGPETSNPASIQEIKAFLRRELQGPVIDRDIADRIMNFMQRRLDTETRKEAFYYLFDILKTLQPTRDLLSARAMVLLQQYPAVARKLATFVPEVLSKAFTIQDKCLMPRPYLRQMVLDDTGLNVPVNLESTSICTSMIWNFRPVENGKYFVIWETNENVAIGIRDRQIIRGDYGSSLDSNPSFHWTLGLDSLEALQFIHRTTDLLLSADSSSYSTVQLKTYSRNDGGQNWLIETD